MRGKHGIPVRTVLIMALALFALSPLGRVHAQGSPPPPLDRFQWVEGLDDQYPRDGGTNLSRRAGELTATREGDLPLAQLFAHYPTSDEILRFLRQLHADYPRLLAIMEVGRSWQGRPIMAVRVGNEAAGDLDQRPALYVDGQHHAREAVSAQTVLYFLWYLVSRYGSDPLVTHLLDTRTVYAIPSVNPDGNDIFLESDQRQRKTANPAASDDDGDGLFDEDGRDGAGYGTYDTYHCEFEEYWVAKHPDNPLVKGYGDYLVSSPSFVGIFDSAGQEIVQMDDDADGETGEDPPGGVDPNRNYDSHWELGDDDPTTPIYHGPGYFSEPETRAVRDFVQARPNIVTASTFHSGSDVLLHPWGWTDEEELPDAFWYEMMSRKGSQLTEANGFQGAPYGWTAQMMDPDGGSTMDWLYERGILTWTPEVYGASVLSFSERITTTNTYTVGVSIGEAFNPSPSDMHLTADRWMRWSLYLLAATPNVGVSSVQVKDGNLVVTLANDGLLPLDVEMAVEMGRESYHASWDGLSASQRTWSLPLPSKPGIQKATITLTARSAVGAGTGPSQVEVVKLKIDGEAVSVVQGRLEEPFVELADFFGGWFAGPE